ncbi:hypothetical protein [Micromonospora parva]|uniref:hypothetical protein n=1 Tax=Micromonospora parva TaxID=1464048 RepID=UPI0033C3ABC4
MGHDQILDPELEAVLGSAAPALQAWGRIRGLRWELDRRLTEGRSGATVAFVIEQDRHAAPLGRTSLDTTLLLKLTSDPDVDLGKAEFARQREAIKHAPPDFALSHLTSLAPEGHDLVAVGDGRWIMFQQVGAMPLDGAGSSIRLDDLDVVSKALASVSAGGAVSAAGSATEEAVSCSPEAFTGFCAQVVGKMLSDWVGQPSSAAMEAGAYLREVLEPSRLVEGRPLAQVGIRLSHPWLIVGDDSEPLPNPFHMLRVGGPTVRALLGPIHGDLHTGNILAPVRALAANSPFRLIDLARYRPEAPLAGDPAGLLLFVVTRVLRHLDESALQELLHLLVGSDHDQETSTGHIPAWLTDFATRIRVTTERWAMGSGHPVERSWRPQWYLSLAGAALILLARATTRLVDRMWLLRLAGRATRAFHSVAGGSPPRTGVTTVYPETLAHSSGRSRVVLPDTWRERFCDDLPALERKASEPRTRERLDALEQAALAGIDRHAEFRHLWLELIGSPLDLRDGGGDDAPVDEVFTCPLPRHRCSRVVRPRRSSDEPRCPLNRTRMRHEFW